ncbi:DEAD/DEAH box helicase [Mycoplasma amphoriforme]|uniref:Helicase ATP-binding domain-containing protein n=1 Tax=Mycoplasma amphoriforme A39 TaxID=572419 RepID=A0A292IIK6_9MOLU|nr:unnamed protein product [Mycoplasma amphoriforme A39]
MKTALFAFQEKALKNLLSETDKAIKLYRNSHKSQVISFSAPTGAGKTIIMTAFIESILFGCEQYFEQPDAIFVWLSDTPELNEQSKLKINSKSDKIDLNQCRVISGENFDQEFLDDGQIYFLNTQKIGRDKNLTKKGDRREYTIWETLKNTIREKSNRLYFIIDEAHRGTQGREAKQATTIMQKFIKGSDFDDLSPMPVVVGISATPERFNSLVETVGSDIHKVSVSPSEVKSSGLLKDRIIVSYSEEASTNKAMAVLQAAADDWKNKWDGWKEYCYKQKLDNINPIFIVQVEDGTDKEITSTPLDESLRIISERTGYKFTEGEVVHTFAQTNSSIIVNNLKVPFEEPSHIQDTEKIKIVFFKKNLSTGWDCPRAETMMSFRKAEDATYVAQLLGRMVRTPMQMHIQTNDSLNDVRLFLPFFKQETVEAVVQKLQATDQGNIPVDFSNESIENKQIETWSVVSKSKNNHLSNHSNQKSTNVFSHLSNKPDNLEDNHEYNLKQSQNLINSSNETILDFIDPMVRFDHQNQRINERLKANANEINRRRIVEKINNSGLLTYKVNKDITNNSYLKSMFSLLHFLYRSGLNLEVEHHTRQKIDAMIDNYINDLKSKNEYEKAAKKVKDFKLSSIIFDAFGTKITTSDHPNISFFSTDIDIDRQFKRAEIKFLGDEGIGQRHLDRFNNESDNALIDLKIDVILFASDHNCIDQLEAYAKQTFHQLCDQYRREVIKLSESLHNQYDKIISDSSDQVSPRNFRLPESIDMKVDNDGKKYENHLFINQNIGYAKIKLNEWESELLDEEMKRDDFVCWFRNQSRAHYALCIPYEIDGETKATYPDFLIIRRDLQNPEEFIIDILEPHNPHFIDNLGKAQAFAKYAEENKQIGRIQLIKKDGSNSRFKRLDLAKSVTREKVLKARDHRDLLDIFKSDGQYE